MPDMAESEVNRQNDLAESVPDTTVISGEEEQVRKDFPETWLWSLDEIPLVLFFFSSPEHELL